MDESVFASDEELQKLGVERISNNGGCMFLDRSGRCLKYDDRPFECRIFPYDITRIGGKLQWIVWEVCPLQALLDHEKYLDDMEVQLSRRWPMDYIENYVRYHEQNQPEKYSRERYKIIRELRWPSEK